MMKKTGLEKAGAFKKQAGYKKVRTCALPMHGGIIKEKERASESYARDLKESSTMNESIQTMWTRHAIRRFQDRPVPKAELDQILTAGLYAPSAGNNQYSRIVVCEDKAINEELGKINRYMMFQGKDPGAIAHSVSAEQPSIQDDFSILNGYYGAPVVLTIFTRDHRYGREDAAMIAENIMLAAHFLGIGSCYVGRTKEVFQTEMGQALRQKWGVPDDLVAVCNVLLGYREGPAPKDKPRKEGRIIWA